MAAPGAYSEASQAMSALIWSIIGLVCCGPAVIVGYVQAKGELAGIDAGQRNPANKGTADAAKVIALIGGGIWLFVIISITLLVSLGVASGILDELIDLGGISS